MKTSPPTGAERAQIIEGFIAVVAARGFREARMDAVLVSAGVGEAAFERHFVNLDDCFHASWDYVSERYMPNALAAYERANGWREQIRAVGRAILDYLVARPDHGWILFVEGPAPSRPGGATDPNVEVFIELIDRGRFEMEDPDFLTRATAEGIAGAVNERIADTLKRGADDELPRLMPELMYLVVLPYLGPEAAAEELHRGID